MNSWTSPASLDLRKELHPWAFKGLSQGRSFLTKKDWRDPKVLGDQAGLLPLGEHWFLYSPKSFRCLQRLGPSVRNWPGPEIERIPNFDALGGPWIQILDGLVEEAMSLRQSLFEGDCYRWIYSAHDGLPGLILDRFELQVVAQIQTEAMEWLWPYLKPLIERRVEAVRIFEKRDSDLRRAEGLDQLEGSKPALDQIIEWNGLKWRVNFGSSQKTGGYLDQGGNHLSVRDWAVKFGAQNVWDIFCYEGGFGLHLAKAGMNVTFLDQSATALSHAEVNVKLNEISDSNCTFVRGDAFEFLTAQKNSGAQCDMIILDPPPLSRKDKTAPLRALHSLLHLSLQCLGSEGLIVLCTCTHQIKATDVDGVISEVAQRSRRNLRILERRGASPDHAVRVPDWDGEYLHLWVIRAHGPNSPR